MSYVPLHHKYRPQTFAQLVGQEAIATTLSNALNKAQIAPAYLFTGARGTGKTSSARIFAKSLNCIAGDRPTPDPCGECETCRSITKGNALDVIEIDAASNTGVDNIRELIDRAQFAPVQCRYKVYVIDECLTGDSLVLTQDGWQRIDDPAIKGKVVLSYNENSERWEWKQVKRWLVRGEKPTLIIKTDRREIRCTGNHLIRTVEGWTKAQDLQIGVPILSPESVTVDRRVQGAGYAPLPIRVDGQGFDSWSGESHSGRGAFPAPAISKQGFQPSQPQRANTSIALLEKPQAWTTGFETVRSIAPGIIEPVYDLEVEDNHNFVANGLLVHNCHMLTGAAFNALLKTLEEPPNRVVFVLATTDPQRVLPTIISRCQRFDFRRIPLDAMVGHLTMIARQESINITQEAIQLVSQIAQGGLRDAESLLDQLSLMSEQVDSEQVWDLVGAVPERDLLSLVQAIAADDPETAIDLTRRLMDRGREPLIVLQNLASFYRDLLIARTAPNRPDLVAITPSTWEQMCELVQSLPGKLLLNSQQHLRSAELQIKNTTQPRLWLEVTLLGLLPSAIAPEAIVSNPQAIKQTIAKPAAAVVSAPVQTPVAAFVSVPVQTPVAAFVSAPVQMPVVEPVVVAIATIAPPIELPAETPEEPPAATPSNAFIADGAELQGIWQQILGEIDLASTRGIVSASCYLLELNGNALKIAVRTKGMLPTVKTKVQSLGKAATKALKQSVKIALVVVEGGEPMRSPTVPPNPIQPKPLTDNAPKSSPSPSTPAPKKPPQKTTSPPKIEPEPPSPPPVFQPPTTTAWTPDDPLNRAAKSLAEAFAGSIVDVDDAPLVSSTVTDTIEEVEEIEESTDTEDEKPNLRNVPF